MMTALPFASPAEAGAQLQRCLRPGDFLDNRHLGNWTPACAGEAVAA
jgi:hypothetical protein